MVRLGKTEVNREVAKAMGKEVFMKTFKGKISIDLNQAWEIINKGSLMTSTDVNEKPKKYSKKANEVVESPSEEKQG